MTSKLSTDPASYFWVHVQKDDGRAYWTPALRARPIAIDCGFPCDLFVHTINRELRISEARTGAFLGSSAAEDVTILDVTRILQATGEQEFNSRMDELIKKHGLSPRFKQLPAL